MRERHVTNKEDKLQEDFFPNWPLFNESYTTATSFCTELVACWAKGNWWVPAWSLRMAQMPEPWLPRVCSIRDAYIKLCDRMIILCMSDHFRYNIVTFLHDQPLILLRSENPAPGAALAGVSLLLPPATCHTGKEAVNSCCLLHNCAKGGWAIILLPKQCLFYGAFSKVISDTSSQNI
jgi:hypothetical protein